jgi:hypothetical protein
LGGGSLFRATARGARSPYSDEEALADDPHALAREEFTTPPGMRATAVPQGFILIRTPAAMAWAACHDRRLAR